MRLALLAVALLGVSCAPTGWARRAPLRAEGALRPGRTRVLLGSGPGGPYRLDRLVVTLDGAVVYLNADPASLPTRRVLADFPDLPTGDHTLSALFELSRSCTPLGSEREVVQVRASDTFVLDGRGAVVELRLVGEEPSGQDGEALRIAFEHRGAEPASFIESPALGVDDQACLPLSEPARALCRVEIRMAEARRARDVVWLACLGDKRAAIEDARSVLERLGDAADPASQAARAEAQRRAVQAAREGEECLGLDMVFVGAVPQARLVRACEGDDPFVLDQSLRHSISIPSPSVSGTWGLSSAISASSAPSSWRKSRMSTSM